MAEVVVPEEIEEVPEETPVEEPVEEVIPEPEPEPEPEPAPEEIEEEPKPSRRESLRIQQLITRMQNQAPAPTARPTGGLDYERTLDADPETIAQLQADRDRVAQQQYNAGLEQSKSIQFTTRLEIDAPRVEAQHPIIDPNNKDSFDPVTANAINQWYLATAGYDPQTGRVQNSNIRYSDFVEGIFELADVLAGEKTAQVTSAIKRQASQTGIRPGGTTAKTLNLNKSPEDMSNEELEAKLKTVLG